MQNFFTTISQNIIKPKFRKEDVYWRYPIIYKNDREQLIDANRKGLIITKHYPAINKFQSNSNLKALNYGQINLNFFVKPGLM